MPVLLPLRGGEVSHTGRVVGCDCKDYSIHVERDCCCVGGTECIDGRRRSESAPSIPQGAPLTDHDCRECDPGPHLSFQTAREFRDQMDAEARDTGLALARLAEFAEGAGFESSGIKWQPDGWWAWVTGESFTDEVMGATAHEAIDNLFDVLEDME